MDIINKMDKINNINEVLQEMLKIDVEKQLKENGKYLYYNRYVLFNNSRYSDIEIKFNNFSMYLNLKILSRFSKFFESKQKFEYNKNDNNIIIVADNIYEKYIPLQQTLTWFYFQYKDIIKPINYDYVSLFYLNNYLIIHEEFLIQIIEMIFDIRNNSIFYKKLYDGFKECLLDENTIINIHKFIANKKEFFDTGFLIDEDDKKYCGNCGYLRYCCMKCDYCANDCQCKKQEAIIYILPSIWLATINYHKYPVNIINFRKYINKNICDQQIDINYKMIDELLCKIKEQIDEVKISINVIFGNI